eukprot:TRINITY_DN12674_c0_g1_i3.p1 TRINITY_DN12674_c0_g1~~TRINITY_DN12674_c0_g1_i3.p1  ORF type:complete len:794 (+),score=195.46 TRINITY_DN12674_c0_g1_i3:152-2533(+)
MSRGHADGGQETIKIFLRLRPAANPSENYTIEKDFHKATVKFHLDKLSGRDDEVINNSIEDYKFLFDDVFDRSTTQDQIFEHVAMPCVANALQGYNSTLFAYGQTGSGKTFSITGGQETFAQRGIIPRSVDAVFDYADAHPDRDVQIRVSYLQIYNDKGQDLLNKGKEASCMEDLQKVIVHEMDDEFRIRDLGQHPCSTREKVLELLFIGDQNRQYCETPMNLSSSRSHCIFTILMEQRQHGSAVVTRSKLNLVDLAGSERIKKSGSEGKLQQEARYINLSLHYLQKVITALCDKAEGRREHIPYRESMMTMVLRDSLGGNCKTVMLATGHPQDAFMDETISTCKFAQRVASVKVNAHINEETDPHLVIKKLKAENAALKEELAMYRSGDQAGDRVLSEEEESKCRQAVQRYLSEGDDDARLTGLEGDMARIFYCFRYMAGLAKGKAPPQEQVPYREEGSTGSRGSDAEAQPGAALGGNYTVADSGRVAHLKTQLQQKDNEISMLLNIVQKYQTKRCQAATQTGADAETASASTSAAVDVPSHRAKPLGPQQDQMKMAAIHHKLSSDYNLDILDVHGMELFKDTAKAFEQFRKSWRKFEQIEKQKNEQAQRCDNARALAAKINGFSKEIAGIKNRIQQLRAERATQGWTEPDAQETQLFSDLDTKKTVYRKHVAELAEEKKVYEHFQGVLKGVSVKLSQDFESWWTLRQWQITGGGGEQEEGIKPFSELRFANPASHAKVAPAPQRESGTSAASDSFGKVTESARTAAPDAEVQSELQKLMQAREKLRCSMQA